jgi:CRISPR-associated protein Cmx8
LTKGKGANKQVIPPKREEKVKDKTTGKDKTIYIYDQVIPRAAFLAVFQTPNIWLKLWRNAIWGTLRGGSPQTRRPYEQRARKEVLNEVDKVWKDLHTFYQKQAKSQLHCSDIASSVFIGAQAANAERVPFRGKADEVFLLHFWPVVMGVYVPQVMDRKGGSKFTGSYVLVVPDVSDLEGFVKDFPDTTAQLKPELAGYRPREAAISLPQEGGLEYLHQLSRFAKAKAERGELAYSIAGVEVYHLEKQGNNIRMLGADRVSMTPRLLEQYETIRGCYRDPLFKRQRIFNLLRGEPWYLGFDQLFSLNNSERFIGSQANWFSSDSRKGFEVE